MDENFPENNSQVEKIVMRKICGVKSTCKEKFDGRQFAMKITAWNICCKKIQGVKGSRWEKVAWWQIRAKKNSWY